MAKRVKQILQLAAICMAFPHLVRAEERVEPTTLIDASAQRLALAREVALAKWDDSAPVEDVTRERQVIDAVIAAGREAGVPAEFVSRFFSAQIEANKLIHVRPQIDHLESVLVSALVDETNVHSRNFCRAKLAEAISDHKATFPEISGCLLTTALERALGPFAMLPIDRKRFRKSSVVAASGQPDVTPAKV